MPFRQNPPQVVHPGLIPKKLPNWKRNSSEEPKRPDLPPTFGLAPVWPNGSRPTLASATMWITLAASSGRWDGVHKNRNAKPSNGMIRKSNAGSKWNGPGLKKSDSPESLLSLLGRIGLLNGTSGPTQLGTAGLYPHSFPAHPVPQEGLRDCRPLYLTEARPRSALFSPPPRCQYQWTSRPPVSQTACEADQNAASDSNLGPFPTSPRQESPIFYPEFQESLFRISSALCPRAQPRRKCLGLLEDKSLG